MKKILAPKPIEFNIPDLSGKEHEFIIESLPMEKIKALEKVSLEATGLRDKVVVQMVELFGGKEENYDIYDYRVLNSALDYISTEMLNPT